MTNKYHKNISSGKRRSLAPWNHGTDLFHTSVRGSSPLVKPLEIQFAELFNPFVNRKGARWTFNSFKSELKFSFVSILISWKWKISLV